MFLNNTGSQEGRTVTVTLQTQVAPVPIATRVDIFRERLRNDTPARAKGGQPHHNVTEEARSSCSHVLYCDGAIFLKAGNRQDPTSSIRTGNVSNNPSQKRLVTLRSSSLGLVGTVAVGGSSTISQIEQLPRPAQRISGYIKHVHTPLENLFPTWWRGYLI